MRLREPAKLLEIWNHAFEQGANVVLMRHAPKSGSDESDLSEEGAKLARQYGDVLSEMWDVRNVNPILSHTSKSRTVATLKLLFPGFESYSIALYDDLEVNRVTPYVQKQCNELHARIAHWRGYFLNHTYFFLEQLGGEFDAENIHTVVAERMERGVKHLFSVSNDSREPIIYCGHSPAIEVVCERLLNVSLAELGGFLNPLDSIHLRKVEERIEFISRTHVIVDYMDLESETYYGK